MYSRVGCVGRRGYIRMYMGHLAPAPSLTWGLGRRAAISMSGLCVSCFPGLGHRPERVLMACLSRVRLGRAGVPAEVSRVRGYFRYITWSGTPPPHLVTLVITPHLFSGISNIATQHAVE